MGGKRRPTNIRFSAHSLQRMFERRISEEEVRAVVADGRTVGIETRAKPLPVHRIAGVVRGRRLVVVLGVDRANDVAEVITLYPERPEDVR